MGSVTTNNGVKVEVANLAITYAMVIEYGVKTFDRCPTKLKTDTAVILIISGLEDLVTVEKYKLAALEKIKKAEETLEEEQ